MNTENISTTETSFKSTDEEPSGSATPTQPLGR